MCEKTGNGAPARPGAISRCFRTETSIRHQSPLIFPEPPSLQHDEYKNCWVIDKTGPAEPCEARTEDLFCISIISPSSITLSLSFWQHWISGAFLVLITGIYHWYLAERSKIEARPGLFSTCCKICMGHGTKDWIIWFIQELSPVLMLIVYLLYNFKLYKGN